MLVVKFWGSQKLNADFRLCRVGELAPLTPASFQGQPYFVGGLSSRGMKGPLALLAMGLGSLRLSEIFLMQVKFLVFPSIRAKVEFHPETWEELAFISSS